MAMSVPHNLRQRRDSLMSSGLLAAPQTAVGSVVRTSRSMGAATPSQSPCSTTNDSEHMDNDCRRALQLHHAGRYSSTDSETTSSTRSGSGRALSTNCRVLMARLETQRKFGDAVRIEGNNALSNVLLKSAQRTPFTEDRVVRDPHDDHMDYASEARTSWSKSWNLRSRLEAASVSKAGADFSENPFVRWSCPGMHARVPGEPGPPSGGRNARTRDAWRCETRDSWLKSAPKPLWGKSIIDRTVADYHPATPTPKQLTEEDEIMDLHELLDQTRAQAGVWPEKMFH